jgi:hypothetical protein
VIDEEARGANFGPFCLARPFSQGTEPAFGIAEKVIMNTVLLSLLERALFLTH